jgi:large subunit ribosomal protein L11
MNAKEEIAGYITVKHVYEIAKIKSNDIIYDCVDMKDIFSDVLKSARSMGIKVVHRMDAKEYQEFLEKRKETVKQQLLQLEEIRQARMLRTG